MNVSYRHALLATLLACLTLGGPALAAVPGRMDLPLGKDVKYCFIDEVSNNLLLARENRGQARVTLYRLALGTPKPKPVKVTEGTFVYVAIDEQGNKRALPPKEE